MAKFNKGAQHRKVFRVAVSKNQQYTLDTYAAAAQRRGVLLP